MFLDSKELCGQQHNAQSGDGGDIANFIVVPLQARASANVPAAKLDDVGARVFVKFGGPLILETVEERIRTVGGFNSFDHFWDSQWKLVAGFNATNLLFGG